MTEKELLDCMKSLYQKQRMCLKIQKLLIVLSIVFYKYAIISLFVHVAIIIICGGFLSNKATLLARKKYPYVLLRASCVGKGAGWDPYIIDEAKRCNDDLTVKILRFNHWTVYCFIAAMLGNISIWCLVAAFKLY